MGKKTHLCNWIWLHSIFCHLFKLPKKNHWPERWSFSGGTEAGCHSLDSQSVPSEGSEPVGALARQDTVLSPLSRANCDVTPCRHLGYSNQSATPFSPVQALLCGNKNDFINRSGLLTPGGWLCSQFQMDRCLALVAFLFQAAAGSLKANQQELQV